MQKKYNNTDVNILVKNWNGDKPFPHRGHKHHCRGKTYLSLILMNNTRATAIVVEHKTDTNPVTINDVVVALLVGIAAAGADVKAWGPKLIKS